MEKRDSVTITYDLDDLRALVCSQATKTVPDYIVESVRFNVQGVNDPTDWRGAQPLDYVLKNAVVTMTKKGAQ